MNAHSSKNWYAQEVERIKLSHPDAKSLVILSGYGPSGTPHIGTLVNELLRPTMIAKTFAEMDGRPVKVVCIVDDFDGLRKVPPNLPQQEMLARNIDMPLCAIPDPFGGCASFAAHNTNLLKQMIEHYDLSIEMLNASDCYKSGVFNEQLSSVLSKHQQILDIIRPTLGSDRQATYSPFMPVCNVTGKILKSGVVEYRDQTIVYRNSAGDLVETPVTDGHCKLQWHVHFAVRWASFKCNYEMYGKDILPSAKLADQICMALDCAPPTQMMYEMFLDTSGQKISKSVGNGDVSLEDWVRIAPPGSLYYFAQQDPVRATRVNREKVMACVDKFLCDPTQSLVPEKLRIKSPISYQMLVELAVISRADPKIVENMLIRYGHKLDEATKNLVEHACQYTTDLLKERQIERPNQDWAIAIQKLITALEDTEHTEPEKIQEICYQIGNEHGSLSEWFRVLYRGLFGADRGPRIGTFLSYLGKTESIKILRDLISCR